MLLDRRQGSWVLRLALAAAIAAAAGGVGAEQPSGDPVGQLVAQVRVEGNETVPLHKVMANIRTRAGRALDITVLEEDVKRLNRQFVDARPVYQTAPEGGLIVTFRVVERPTLRYIKYVGMRSRWFSNMEKTLNRETGLKVGDPRDPYAIESARGKIEEYFRSKGCSKVRCTIFEGDKPSDKGAVFIIHEGPQEKIWDVNFVGCQIVSGGRLKTQIQSKAGFLWTFGGKVDREKIEQDVDRLTAYYRSLGFFRAEIARELEFQDDWLYLTFYINEGPRYVIRDISIVGNTKFPKEDLMKDVKIKGGDYFDQATLTGDRQWIEDIYGEEGYIFAKATPEPRFLDEPGTMDLVFNVEEGDRWRIGRIHVQIQGDDPHTRRETVLNRVSLRPGDIANIRKKRDSERRLLASGLFVSTPDKQHQWPKIILDPNQAELAKRKDDDELAEQPPKNSYRGQSPDDAEGGSGQASVESGNVRVADLELTPEGAVVRPWIDAEGRTGEAFGLDTPNDLAPWLKWNANLAPIHPTMTVRAQSPDRWGDAAVRNRESTSAEAWRSHRPSTTAGRAPAPARPSTNTRQSAALYAQRPLDHDPSLVAVRFQDPGYGFNPNAGRAMPSLNPVQQPTYPNTQARQSYGQPPGNLPMYAQPPAGYAQQGQPLQPAPAYPQMQPPTQSTISAPPVYQQPSAPGQYGQPQSLPSGGIAYPSTSPSPSDLAPGQLPPGSGYNDPVQLFPDGGYGFMPDEPTQVIDPVVEVHETQTGRFMVGAGYNSQAGVVGSIVLEEQNFDWRRVPRSWEDVRNATAFRGGGQVLRLEAAPGTQVQRYSFSFREPYWFDTPVNFGLSGYLFSRRYVDWFEQRLGGNVRLGYQLTPDLSLGSTLGAENVEVTNPSIPTPPQLARVLGDNSSFSTGMDLIYDTRDSAFLPTQGFRMALNGEFVFGSFDYPRATLDLQKHFWFHQRADGSGRHVVSLSGRLGVSGTQTPIYDSFFAGGYSTLRGFNFRGASPQVFGVPVGGRFQMLGTVQYMFPLVASDMIRGVTFVDFGSIEEDVRFDADTFRVAPGAGLRISVPALGPAPIAIDFAFPIHHAPGDDIQNFSLFVGLNF